MLDALVLADRPVEYHALPCIFCCPAQRVLTDPDRFDRNQDALGIEAMQDVGKALALLADPVGFRNEQAVDEDGIGIDRLAAHLGNAMNIDLRPIEVSVEDRDAVGRPRTILIFGGPGQQHDLVGDLRGRGPDFLAVYEVTARYLLSKSLDPGRVQPSVRFGETEAALIFTGDQPRDPARLLLWCALHNDRMGTEQIDMHR